MGINEKPGCLPYRASGVRQCPDWVRGLIFCLCPLMALPAYAEADANHKIELVKDNVYRFTAGHYHSVFMVTEQGIFVADPINREAAGHLKKALSARFKQPIKYLAYSHNHVDHSLGGDVLDSDAVTILAHRYAAEDMRWTQLPTALPDVTFDDAMQVNLGDSQVEMRYYGPNNGRGSVSFRFMPANVLFVVDWILVGRMPYKNLQGYDIHGMIRSTQAVLSEAPFDVFVGGHADIGQRQDVERYLQYLQALYAAVRDGMLAGKSKAELQASIALPQFSDLRMYEEWLPLNVAGVYDTLMDRSYFNFRPDVPPAQE